MKRSVLLFIFFLLFPLLAKANTQVPAAIVQPVCTSWNKNLNCTMTNQQLVDNAVDQLSAGGGSNGYLATFSNSNLSSGVLTVNHNLNSQFAIVQVSDNNNNIMLPDAVTLTNANTALINLSSRGVISGTWNVAIIPVIPTTPGEGFILLSTGGYILLSGGGYLQL